MPALNEAQSLKARTQDFLALRGPDVETLLVDGGSHDETMQIGLRLFDRVLEGARGRARQMNLGAAAARGQWLCFVHADTRLPATCVDALREHLARQSAACWGRFDVRIDANSALFRMLEFMMNQRSAVSGIVTGDQCLFVTAQAFKTIGCFPDQPLMEDVELSRRLRRLSWPLRMRETVTTDARRWQRHGVVRTMALMWALRLGYWLGVPPVCLARWYAER